MKDEKTTIDNIEIGDIIWVDRKNAYCDVIDINFSMNGKVALTMKQSGAGEPTEPSNKVFTKFYSFNKEVRLFT